MTPIAIAIALSLYGYNVSADERARKLHDHFKGECLDFEELRDILLQRAPYLATELPYPTAKVYVEHALDRYGQEASRRATTGEDYLNENVSV